MAYNGSSDEKALTPKQEQLITALLSAPTIAIAAQAAGVPYKTAHNWLKLPHFTAAYKAAKKRMFEDSLSALQSGIDAAINTLKRNMTSEDTPPAVQVRAAQIWLEQAVKLFETNELEAKLELLEQLIKDTTK